MRKPMMYGVMTHLHIPHNGNVLMVRKPQKGKDPNSGLCTLPGGKLEPEEKGLKSLKGRLEAAVRETEQETGLCILNPTLRGTVLFDNNERIFDNWPDAPDYLVHIVSSNHYSGNLLKKGDGEEIPFWVNQYNIPHLPQSAGDSLIYDWIRWHQKPFFGVIKHKGKEIDLEGSFVDFL